MSNYLLLPWSWLSKEDLTVANEVVAIVSKEFEVSSFNEAPMAQLKLKWRLSELSLSGNKDGACLM